MFQGFVFVKRNCTFEIQITLEVCEQTQVKQLHQDQDFYFFNNSSGHFCRPEGALFTQKSDIWKANMRHHRIYNTQCLASVVIIPHESSWL